MYLIGLVSEPSHFGADVSLPVEVKSSAQYEDSPTGDETSAPKRPNSKIKAIGCNE